MNNYKFKLYIYLFTFYYLFIHSLIHSFIHSFVRWFVDWTKWSNESTNQAIFAIGQTDKNKLKMTTTITQAQTW